MIRTQDITLLQSWLLHVSHDPGKKKLEHNMTYLVFSISLTKKLDKPQHFKYYFFSI